MIKPYISTCVSTSVLHARLLLMVKLQLDSTTKASINIFILLCVDIGGDVVRVEAFIFELLLDELLSPQFVSHSTVK